MVDIKEKQIDKPRLVHDSTSTATNPREITARDKSKIFTNKDATEMIHFDLEPALEGREHSFAVLRSVGLRMNADGTDTIRFATTVSAAGSFVQSTEVGANCILRCVEDGEWMAFDVVGTWGVDV